MWTTYRLGKQHGHDAEKKRCQRLCLEALFYRASGTVRWLANAIDADDDKLMDRDEFFGPKI
jgi:hypothetical protein